MYGVSGVIGVGYEGRELDEFVASLVAAGVTRVVDVRFAARSRKRGFAKTALAAALGAAGIAYEHQPALGNPPSNRAGFRGSEAELAAARAAYAQRLASVGAPALAAVAAAARRETVALLCFERDQHRCHREVLLGALTARSPSS